MRGHIRPRGKNNYSIVMDLEPGPNGERRQKWISVAKYLGLPKATKKQAEIVLAEVLQKLRTQDFIQPEKVSLGEYLRYWLENYARQSVRQTTMDNYTSLIDKHIIPELGHIQIAKLSPMHLQEFYNKKLQYGRADGKPGGLAPKTVRELHSLIHKALDQALKWQAVTKNVARAVSPPRKEKKEIKHWTKDEVKEFLNSIENERLFALYHLALNTGMRRGELLGLRWVDMRLNDGYVAVRQNLVKTNSGILMQEPKTSNSRRNISISSNTVAALKAHKKQQLQEKLAHGPDYKDNGLVFCRLNGLPLYPDGVSDQFNRLVAKAGVKSITFHDLRHTHATLLLVAGIHPKVVSERLGHYSVALTLDLYSHVIPGLDQEAARKLDEQLM
jgi:integrase